MQYLTKYLNPYGWLRRMRSLILTRKVNRPLTPFSIRVSNHLQPVVIKKAPGAKFSLNGTLYFDSYFGSRDPITIILEQNSRLTIDGDFSIGNGTSIIIQPMAHLYIGGKREESSSGITERSRIMVNKNMRIGFDCIIAWDVFITDCDWHTIAGKSSQKDVLIGDHVWIAVNSSILKGSNIGNGCVIGAHSLVSGNTLPDNCIASGNPLKIQEKNIRWQRDMIQN